jgi:hypothetical protein
MAKRTWHGAGLGYYLGKFFLVIGHRASSISRLSKGTHGLAQRADRRRDRLRRARARDLLCRYPSATLRQARRGYPLLTIDGNSRRLVSGAAGINPM